MKGIPEGWETAEFTVCTRTAYVHANAPGLAINKRNDLWVVTHVRSGSFLQPGFVKVDEAAGFALDLAPLTDWSRKGTDILEDTELRAAVVLLRERMNFGRSVVMIADAPVGGPGVER